MRRRNEVTPDTEDWDKHLDKDDALLWGVFQFGCLMVLIGLILWPRWAWAEVTWTDFSPQPVVIVIDDPQTDEVIVMIKDPVPMKTEAVVKTENEIDKEQYRVYFEDKKLVLMVLGGLEYWRMNCGTLTATGEYFVKMAIKKHDIDEDEMSMDMSFQTGLFAATLYNSCDHFLNQVETIGLGMMFIKTERTNVETINNISDSEV